MRFDAAPLHGRFVRRYKRFFADVRLDEGGELVTAHCPNTGSLLGCLEEGAPVWLRDSGDPRRKLRTTWQAVRIADTWVNVDTSLPNRVVAEAVAAGAVPALRGYAALRREVGYGSASRIDLLLEDPRKGHCYVEVKSTTLARGRAALFPDAVTERGRKHLAELAEMVARGHRAVQLFFVGRDDVGAFRPAWDVDPAYAEALVAARAAGVEVIAYSARVTPRRLELGRRLRLALGAGSQAVPAH